MQTGALWALWAQWVLWALPGQQHRSKQGPSHRASEKTMFRAQIGGGSVFNKLSPGESRILKFRCLLGQAGNEAGDPQAGRRQGRGPKAELGTRQEAVRAHPSLPWPL